MSRQSLLVLFWMTLLIGFPNWSFAKTVRYALSVSQVPVNLSGNKTVDWALMVNGSIPAPTLEFTEGDEAEIVVKNLLAKEEVSIHWHGILLPPEMDGVAYVNTPPILPGQSYTFRFKIRQHGTYWYHSHTALQEQKGVYGAFIIHPKKKKIAYDKDVAVVLSDWSDENADQILRNLRKDGDYYLYKKKSIRSWAGAMRAGALGSFLGNEWNRMGGMDLSDVGYDAFLVNGKRDSQLLEAHPGEKIRIRIINAAASSYFYVSLGQEPMQVISADGVDIQPQWAKELLMGMAETYDVLFEVPQHKNYELRATSQDGTGHASGWVGMGEKIFAPDRPAPDLYAPMNHENHSGVHSSPAHAHHTVEPTNTDMHQHGAHHHDRTHSAPEKKPISAIDTLTVEKLRSAEPTDFAATIPRYDLKLVLGGDMERYVWHINGQAIYQDRNLEIREGDVIRFTFVNETMMHHPMHLHGHFFRVLNNNKEYSPLKHTVDVSPHGTRTIEFIANEPGEWMLHCHNLYHMKTGMARVVKYSSFVPKPEIAAHQKHDPHLHDHLYFKGQLLAATNHAEAELQLLKTWDTLEARFETREYDNLDHASADIFYRRWFSNYLHLMAGATYFSEFEKNKTRGALGVGYTLPLLIETSVWVDHMGKIRLNLDKRFQWLQYIYSDAEISFRQQAKTEFKITLMYAPVWAMSVGAVFTEDNVGAGLQYKF